jgi:hypothetical protein
MKWLHTSSRTVCGVRKMENLSSLCSPFTCARPRRRPRRTNPWRAPKQEENVLVGGEGSSPPLPKDSTLPTFITGHLGRALANQTTYHIRRRWLPRSCSRSSSSPRPRRLPWAPSTCCRCCPTSRRTRSSPSSWRRARWRRRRTGCGRRRCWW